MDVDRRDVLKMLGASPFVGLFGNREVSAASSKETRSRERMEDQTWRVFEEPYLSEIAFPL